MEEGFTVVETFTHAHFLSARSERSRRSYWKK